MISAGHLAVVFLGARTMGRIITLTTDYGIADHLVGTMKGVILGIAPDAQIVDITHGVTPFDVLEGALAIGEACRFYPPHTIHVVVVDPGVGTARRPILVSAGEQYFVAPDNGVLSVVISREPRASVRHITADHYFLKPVSRTFHGRDIFSPVAAWLARTGNPADFGEEISDCFQLPVPKPSRHGSSIKGTILRADHYGNLMTNLAPDDAPEIVASGAAFRITLGSGKVTRKVLTFSDGEENEPVLLVGSSGYLEIVTNRGSAAKILQVQPGAEFVLEITNAHTVK
jgi:S-adenosyl-L-methionine hydrolase (adenosine-forming)